MKIGFYNPYLDSFGGGERYILTLASHWSRKHEVTLFWNDESIKQASADRFHLDLSRITVKPNIFQRSFLAKSIETSRYDLIFVLSDGSIPFTLARHNIVHFQIPFKHVVFPFIKQKLYQFVVCNSFFTKEHIDPAIGKRATIIYPPVDIGQFIPGKKKKQILTVGRFNSHYNAKKQDILIDAFIHGYNQGFLKEYTFILAGSMLQKDKDFIEALKHKANTYPIDFRVNCTFADLQYLYESSILYWHAAGFGEQNPQYMEHFGISTVEAMSGGAIPIVFNGGGQKEIIKDDVNGYVWNTTDELLTKTKTILSDNKKQKRLQVQALYDVGKYSMSTFTDAFDVLLTKII